MKKKINIILMIIWMIIIFMMSSFTSSESSNQSGIIVNIITNIFKINNVHTLTIIIRKCAHLIEYLILGYLVHNVIKDYHKKYYISIIICLIYAFSDEIHQIFVPGRSCEFIDIIIDIFGSIIGIYLNTLLINHKKNR